MVWSKDAKDWSNKDGELFTDYIIKGKLSDWIKELAIKDDLIESTPDKTIRITKDEFRNNVINQ